MPDKCQSHDQCIERINGQLGDMRDDLHRGVNELKEMLHAGAVLHTKFEMRFESHDQAIATLQRELAMLKDVPEKRWDQVEGMLWRLAERGILVIIGAALWAFYNGYGGR